MLLSPIIIERALYEKCDAASKNFWCNSKPGVYGRGLCNTKLDPHKATRIGLLGECAVARLLGLKLPDFNYVKGGKPADLHMGNLTIDVKTAIHNYNTMLVYRVSERGVVIPLKSDLYVACVMMMEDNAWREACVGVVGWATREEVEEGRLELGWKKRHKNLVLDYDQLHEMKEMKNVSVSRK